MDFTRLLPGPLCSMLLADFGAEVIKVEDPRGGDPGRQTAPVKGGVSLRHLLINRGKKSLTLNLKAKEGKDVLYRLVERSDVILEGFRPGVMARLKADYATLSGINPGLVYASLTGFGQNGPLKDVAGHDINYIGYAGVLSLTGKGEPLAPGVQIADLGGGLLMLFGVLAALFERSRTTKGRYLDISMLDASAFFLAPVIAEALTLTGRPKLENMRLNGKWACYGVYPAKDGKFLTLGALEPKFWERFCRLVQRLEWVPLQYEEPAQECLKGALRALFLTKLQKDWLGLLEGEDACVGPVLEPEEALDHPQLEQRGLFIKPPASEGGLGFSLAGALGLAAQGAEHLKPAPCLGEHTAQILKEAGYEKDDIAKFQAEGVI